MAPAKRVKARSPAQVKATQAWARSGRRKQAQARAASIAGTGKPPPRTKAQKAASQRFAAAGRAAQAARRAGKTPVTAKKAAAPLPDGTELHELPACAPAALAGHLALCTGICVPDEEVLRLHQLLRVPSLAELLEYAAREGLGGRRLASFWRCDPDCGVPYLLCGVQLPQGYHAAVAVPGGRMLSWGMLLPRTGTPEEAWHLEWEDT